MIILPITQQVSFKNVNTKYLRDVKNKSYVLREFAEHPDLVEIDDKSKKVVEDLMEKTCVKVTISCIDAIETFRYIRDKHPHLKKISEECIELLEYYNAYKTW